MYFHLRKKKHVDLQNVAVEQRFWQKHTNMRKLKMMRVSHDLYYPSDIVTSCYNNLYSYYVLFIIHSSGNETCKSFVLLPQKHT